LNIYITKPAHTRYGQIKMHKYDSIEEFYGECTIWFAKPRFQKPAMCIFGEGFLWYGFDSKTNYEIKFKHLLALPELKDINNKIKLLISETLNEDLTDKFGQQHYKWIGTTEISITLYDEENHKGMNPTYIYLTKPDVSSIKVAGIDRAKVWFSKATCRELPYEELYNGKVYYQMSTGSSNYICGKIFRKIPELEPILHLMWKLIVDSFDFFETDSSKFYYRISKENHKENQGSLEFCKEIKVLFQLV